jgi:hypothetical protein
MLGLLESFAKVAAGVVTLPVAVVADVVTLGGALSDTDEAYTAKAASDIIKNLSDATKPD